MCIFTIRVTKLTKCWHFIFLLQIQKQFPLAFEFNEYYTRFLAYHSVSCRFRTFLLECEEQREDLGIAAAEDKRGSLNSRQRVCTPSPLHSPSNILHHGTTSHPQCSPPALRHSPLFPRPFFLPFCLNLLPCSQFTSFSVCIWVASTNASFGVLSFGILYPLPAHGNLCDHNPSIVSCSITFLSLWFVLVLYPNPLSSVGSTI